MSKPICKSECGHFWEYDEVSSLEGIVYGKKGTKRNKNYFKKQCKKARRRFLKEEVL